MQQGPFQLETYRMGGLPIINRFLARIPLEPVLASRLPGRKPDQDALRLTILLKNLLIAREPIYALAEWTHQWHPRLLAPPHGLPAPLTDDAVARALSKLFDANRDGIHLEVMTRTKREFDLDLSQLNNDTTSVTVHGNYTTADGRKVRGKTTLMITFGHNKDHRPDLKQIVLSLTVSRDGAVPVHYRIYDGNTNDTPTHKEVWEALVELVGGTDFLYVGDSKLCDGDTMRHVGSRGGRFLTVMPRTRGEDALFREWIQTNAPDWQEVAQGPPKKGVPDIWYAMESPVPASDGYRLIWIYSTRMAHEDQVTRERIIHRAVQRLEKLKQKLRNPRTGYRDHAGVANAADKALGEQGARWLDVEVRTANEVSFKQARRGRPGKDTQYRRDVKTRFDIAWTPKKEALLFDARSDGMFPLLTNADLPLADLLDAYRFQPRLEKRFEQLKTVYGVAPVLLKKAERVEAFLSLFFYVMLVGGLIERELRRAMESRGIKSLPVYPEGRACGAPTTDRVFRLFEDVQVHRLMDGERVVQVFPPDLSPVQLQILDLLGVPVEEFTEVW